MVVSVAAVGKFDAALDANSSALTESILSTFQSAIKLSSWSAGSLQLVSLELAEAQGDESERRLRAHRVQGAYDIAARLSFQAANAAVAGNYVRRLSLCCAFTDEFTALLQQELEGQGVFGIVFGNIVETRVTDAARWPVWLADVAIQCVASTGECGSACSWDADWQMCLPPSPFFVDGNVWVAGDWGDCSASCGEGFQEREVVCAGDAPDSCPLDAKPMQIMPCRGFPCVQVSLGATGSIIVLVGVVALRYWRQRSQGYKRVPWNKNMNVSNELVVSDERDPSDRDDAGEDVGMLESGQGLRKDAHQDIPLSPDLGDAIGKEGQNVDIVRKSRFGKEPPPETRSIVAVPQAGQDTAGVIGNKSHASASGNLNFELVPDSFDVPDDVPFVAPVSRDPSRQAANPEALKLRGPTTVPVIDKRGGTLDFREVPDCISVPSDDGGLHFNDVPDDFEVPEDLPSGLGLMKGRAGMPAGSSKASSLVPKSLTSPVRAGVPASVVAPIPKPVLKITTPAKNDLDFDFVPDMCDVPDDIPMGLDAMRSSSPAVVAPRMPAAPPAGVHAPFSHMQADPHMPFDDVPDNLSAPSDGEASEDGIPRLNVSENTPRGARPADFGARKLKAQQGQTLDFNSVPDSFDVPDDAQGLQSLQGNFRGSEADGLCFEEVPDDISIQDARERAAPDLDFNYVPGNICVVDDESDPELDIDALSDPEIDEHAASPLRAGGQGIGDGDEDVCFPPPAPQSPAVTSSLPNAGLRFTGASRETSPSNIELVSARHAAAAFPGPPAGSKAGARGKQANAGEESIPGSLRAPVRRSSDSGGFFGRPQGALSLVEDGADLPKSRAAKRQEHSEGLPSSFLSPSRCDADSKSMFGRPTPKPASDRGIAETSADGVPSSLRAPVRREADSDNFFSSSNPPTQAITKGTAQKSNRSIQNVGSSASNSNLNFADVPDSLSLPDSTPRGALPQCDLDVPDDVPAGMAAPGAEMAKLPRSLMAPVRRNSDNAGFFQKTSGGLLAFGASAAKKIASRTSEPDSVPEVPHDMPGMRATRHSDDVSLPQSLRAPVRRSDAAPPHSVIAPPPGNSPVDSGGMPSSLRAPVRREDTASSGFFGEQAPHSEGVARPAVPARATAESAGMPASLRAPVRRGDVAVAGAAGADAAGMSASLRAPVRREDTASSGFFAESGAAARPGASDGGLPASLRAPVRRESTEGSSALAYNMVPDSISVPDSEDQTGQNDEWMVPDDSGPVAWHRRAGSPEGSEKWFPSAPAPAPFWSAAPAPLRSPTPAVPSPAPALPMRRAGSGPPCDDFEVPDDEPCVMSGFGKRAGGGSAPAAGSVVAGIGQRAGGSAARPGNIGGGSFAPPARSGGRPGASETRTLPATPGLRSGLDFNAVPDSLDVPDDSDSNPGSLAPSASDHRMPDGGYIPLAPPQVLPPAPPAPPDNGSLGFDHVPDMLPMPDSDSDEPDELGLPRLGRGSDDYDNDDHNDGALTFARVPDALDLPDDDDGDDHGLPTLDDIGGPPPAPWDVPDD